MEFYFDNIIDRIDKYATIRKTGERRKIVGVHIYVSREGIKSVRYYLADTKGYFKEKDIIVER